MPTPIKREPSIPTSSFKRARPSEVISLDGEPITKRRRVNGVSAPAPKLSDALAAPAEGNDPTLISPLTPFETNKGAPVVEPPRSSAELVAEAQTSKEGNILDEYSTRLADGEASNVSVLPESTRSPSPSIIVRSPSVQLVPSLKPLKRKWRSKALNSTQTVVDSDYFVTPPLPTHSHAAVIDPTLVPLNQIQAEAAGRRRARHEAAEVESLDFKFEEVGLEETTVGTLTVVETFEQNVNITDYPEELTAGNEPQTFSSPAEETGGAAANYIPFNISDDYQYPMPQYSAVPDVFSNPPVEGSTRTAIRGTPSKSQKVSQPVEEGLTSSHLNQRDTLATRDTLFFEQASRALHAADGYSKSPLPSSSAPHSPIRPMPTHTPTNADASLRFRAAKRNGEGNHLRSSPVVSGRPLTNARAPPQGVPIPVRDPSRIRRSSPPQLQNQSRNERRRTFGGWPTILATPSLHKEGTKISSTRRKRRDSTTPLPTTMVYRDQQEDADWLRSVEKKIKVIPRYADPRKRSIPSFPPETSSDDTNTADESEDEDGLAEKVSKMSPLDIERVMNALNVAPRNKVLKQWKQQNKSDTWITWNGLDFVLEELANRFNTHLTAAREAWAAAGDLVVTEKALYHAQEMSQRTVADVIKFEAEQASKRRMESWAPIRQTSERWRRTSRRNTGHYPHGSGPPEFVPAEAVQVAAEAASSPQDDHNVRRGSSKVLREALEKLPMLSFDGVGPGGVSILRE